MGWFRKSSPAPPDPTAGVNNPATANYMPPQDSVPPWESPDAVNGSYPDIWAANPDAIVARALYLPTPTLGAVPTDTNDFVWSDGLGKMYPHNRNFDGSVMDPADTTLAASYGGNVGLTARTFKLGSRLQTMYYPDTATQQDINSAYLSYFGG